MKNSHFSLVSLLASLRDEKFPIDIKWGKYCPMCSFYRNVIKLVYYIQCGHNFSYHFRQT